MIRVAIVDDHAIVRIGLRRFLQDHDDIVVVHEGGDASELIDWLRQPAFDVLVLDLSLPGGSGVQALAAVRQRAPQLPVLVFSGYPEALYAAAMRRQGANAYLEKGVDPDALVATIRRLHASSAAPNPGRSEGDALHDRLAPREFEVFLRLARGQTNVEAARGMALSPATISKYRGRLMTRFGVVTNSELTYYAVKNGLL